MGRFQHKTFLNRSNNDLHFFLYVLRLISITTGKLSQHKSASYILLKKNFWKGFKTKIAKKSCSFFTSGK